MDVISLTSVISISATISIDLPDQVDHPAALRRKGGDELLRTSQVVEGVFDVVLGVGPSWVIVTRHSNIR
jgi:hypothetical protein